jgi:hypothetical protein
MVAAKPHTTLILAGILLVLNFEFEHLRADLHVHQATWPQVAWSHDALVNGGKVLVTTGVWPTFTYISTILRPGSSA